MMSFQLEIELRHHNKLLMDEVESLKNGSERSWLQISNQADRIEELEAEVTKMRLYNTIFDGVSHPEMYKSKCEEELEAKLKIAVEALEHCRVIGEGFVCNVAIEALTKIKGE